MEDGAKKQEMVQHLLTGELRDIILINVRTNF